MLGDAAGDDAGVVGEIGLDVDRDAVERDPVADADADGRNLVFPAALARHPDADPALAPLAAHVEAGEGADDPVLEVGHVAPHVLPALAQVEHGVGHPLAGPVIGVLPAAAGGMDGQAQRLQQVLRLAAGAGGVERRVLQQPDQLAGPAGADVGDPCFHGRQGLVVGHRAVRDSPFGPRHCGKIGISGGRCKGGGAASCHWWGILVSPAASNRRGHGGIGRRASLRC